MTTASNPSIALLWCVTLLSIGFANSAGRLHVGEFNILLCTLFFIWSALSCDLTSKKCSIFEHIAAIAGVTALVTAFFYKELVFVFAVAFSSAELLRHYRNNLGLSTKRLWSVFIVGILYIMGYALWRLLYSKGSYASEHAISSLDTLWLFSQSDPFIIFVVAPCTILRIVLITRYSIRHTVYDSFLIAASAYALSYVEVGLYNTYYLLPAYGFAVCGLAGLLAQTSVKRSVRILVLSVAGICCANTLPVAVSDMQSLQLVANNHYRFIKELSEWIWKNPMKNGSPRNLVLVGVNPEKEMEIVISLKTFLVSLGIPDSYFRVITAELIDNNVMNNVSPVGNETRYTPEVDDLLIFNPYQSALTLPPLLSPSYHEVLRSESEWAIPRWSGRDWIINSMQSACTFSALWSVSRHYNGYAALLLTRLKTNGTVTPLRSPLFALGPLDFPVRMRSGIIRQYNVLIKNTGTELWPSNGTLSSGMFVNISYRWFNERNQLILEGNRVPIPESMLPQDEAKVTLFLVTPPKAGKYKLLITPVQEGVQWFPAVNGKIIEIY